MRGCWIWLLTCACLVPASCAPEGASAKSSEVRIERITGLESTQVAGVGVQFPGSGERFLYVREDGAWRCVNALDAVALDGALDGLVADLTAATGTSREVADARLGAFGFAEDSPEVTLFGADWRTQQDRDELARFTLARATMEAMATTVASVPSRAIRACPNGMVYASSGTGPLLKMTERCSKKSTGSSLCSALAKSPLAS